MVHLFIENSMLPEGVDFVITDEHNREIPIQEYERRQEGAYSGLWMTDVPPMGFSTLLIHTDQ